MDIEFSCDKCGQRLVVDEKYAGTSVDCPKCQANLPVPYKFQCLKCSFNSRGDFQRCPKCRNIGPGPLGDKVIRVKALFVAGAILVLWGLLWLSMHLGILFLAPIPMLLVFIVIFVSSIYLFKHVKRKRVERTAMLDKNSERGIFPSKSSQELQTRPEEEAVRKKNLPSNALSDFFAFRMMISSILARTIYLLGAIVITIVGLTVMFVEGLAQFRWPIVEGLIIIVGGNLVWRVACEIWNIIFSIHDRLTSIEKTLKQK